MKNELLAFLGWPYYILETLTILYAVFNFLGFLFSLLNESTIHFQIKLYNNVFTRKYPSYRRNPNIDLQSIGIYSKSDIQHHIRTQQFQELLTQMDTIQRQSIDQNLRKLAETAGFSDIYAQDYSGYFKDIKD